MNSKSGFEQESPTKQSLLDEISTLASVGRFQVSRGSSVPRQFFEAILERFGLLLDGDMVVLARRIVAEAGLKWPASGDSSASPSGGGGTVTRQGLLAVRSAVVALRAEESLPPNGPDPIPLAAGPYEWTVMPGQVLSRQYLHERYGGNAHQWLSAASAGTNVFVVGSPGRLPLQESDPYPHLGLSLVTAHSDLGHGRSLLDLLFGQAMPAVVRLFEEAGAGLVRYLKPLAPAAVDANPVLTGDAEASAVLVFLTGAPEGPSAAGSPSPSRATPASLGVLYRAVVPTTIQNPSEPFAVDPDLMDRATAAHADTQNAVADWLRADGCTPLAPFAAGPQFDLAWDTGSVRFVVEVKSVSPENEVQQFRLGLGQALDYAASCDARPVLVLSQTPTTQRLMSVAARARVVLLWPGLFARLKPSDLL